MSKRSSVLDLVEPEEYYKKERTEELLKEFDSAKTQMYQRFVDMGLAIDSIEKIFRELNEINSEKKDE